MQSEYWLVTDRPAVPFPAPAVPFPAPVAPFPAPVAPFPAPYTPPLSSSVPGTNALRICVRGGNRKRRPNGRHERNNDQ